MRKINRFIIILFICFFVASCATVSPYKRVGTFSIDGQRYVSLTNFCKNYSIDWQWDNFSGVLTLKKGSNQANILVGSATAEVNNQIENIRPPFRFYNGTIAVPFEFADRIVSRWIKFKPSARLGESLTYGYKITKVVIDAGHGGNDPGAIGRSGAREKDITLDIAKRLKNLLESKGIDVVLTRSTDKFIPLNRRAQIANKSNADLFISIHVNSNRSRQPYGFETYYFSEASDNLAKALEVAENSSDIEENSSSLGHSQNLKAILGDMIYTENIAASKEVASYICDSTCRIMGLRNRGIKSARFVVLRQTDIPAILVEVGFLSNLKEERFLKNSFYRQQIAEGLTASIANYRRVYKLTKR